MTEFIYVKEKEFTVRSRLMDEAISGVPVGPSLDLSCEMRSQPHECHDKEIDKS